MSKWAVIVVKARLIEVESPNDKAALAAAEPLGEEGEVPVMVGKMEVPKNEQKKDPHPEGKSPKFDPA